MSAPIKERSREWKNGYQRGILHAKEEIWRAVLKYVDEHDPEKAEALRTDIIKAVLEKLEREREAE